MSKRNNSLLQPVKTEVERSQLLAAIEQVGEVIIMTDAQGTIQFVNPAFEWTTGYSRAEAVGQNPRILKSGKQDKHFYRHLWDTISSGKTWTGLVVNKRKDGTLYTGETTISPVRDAADRIINYVAVQHDISEQLRLTAQFQQSQKMEAVGLLAGGVAHDYNNMLSVILGYTELGLNIVDSASPVHDYLKEILKATNRSTDITRQLLAFARKQIAKPVVLDLNKTVENIFKMLRRLIGENITLSFQPAVGLYSLKMDSTQVDQILVNLCVNARDAIGDIGKITIATENAVFNETYCTNHAEPLAGEYVLLTVSDNGCGMDKETIDRIFEPFFTSTGVGKGTGLGLSTVYGIVKQNNGFINVFSEPGKGTIFRIYLPRYSGKITDSQSERAVELPLGHGEMVLVVIDEPSILMMVKKMLENLGYRVLTAGTPDEATHLVKKHANSKLHSKEYFQQAFGTRPRRQASSDESVHQYAEEQRSAADKGIVLNANWNNKIHLLITELALPEMNGRDLSQQLQSLCPSMKILFISGNTVNMTPHLGAMKKEVSFIQKPFSMKDMAINVWEALQDK